VSGAAGSCTRALHRDANTGSSHGDANSRVKRCQKYQDPWDLLSDMKIFRRYTIWL